jgi:hypothetical protein
MERGEKCCGNEKYEWYDMSALSGVESRERRAESREQKVEIREFGDRDG